MVYLISKLSSSKNNSDTICSMVCKWDTWIIFVLGRDKPRLFFVLFLCYIHFSFEYSSFNTNFSFHFYSQFHINSQLTNIQPLLQSPFFLKILDPHYCYPCYLFLVAPFPVFFGPIKLRPAPNIGIVRLAFGLCGDRKTVDFQNHRRGGGKKR